MNNESYVKRLTKEDCIEFKNKIRQILRMQDSGKVEKYNDHLLIMFNLPGTDAYIRLFFYDYIVCTPGLCGNINKADAGTFLYNEWLNFLTIKFPNEYQVDLKENAITY